MYSTAAPTLPLGATLSLPVSERMCQVHALHCSLLFMIVLCACIEEYVLTWCTGCLMLLCHRSRWLCPCLRKKCLTLPCDCSTSQIRVLTFFFIFWWFNTGEPVGRSSVLDARGANSNVLKKNLQRLLCCCRHYQVFCSAITGYVTPITGRYRTSITGYRKAHSDTLLSQ